MKKLLTLLFAFVALAINAQNFDQLRVTGYFGGSQSSINPYYAYGEGTCKDCLPIVKDFYKDAYLKGGSTVQGLTYGLGLGYNFELPGFLVGGEVYGLKQNLKYDLYGIRINELLPNNTYVSDVDLDWTVGTSLIFGPTFGRTLLYGRAGALFGNFNYLSRTNDPSAYTHSEWVPGLNLGAGVKYAITERVAVGAEYNFTRFKDLEQVIKGVQAYGATGMLTTKQQVDLQMVLVTFTVGLGKKTKPFVPVVLPEPVPARVNTIVIREIVEKPATDWGEPEVGKVIKLENIYYDFDQSYIRADAQPDLNKLVSYMREYPNMTIELGSHTDSRGSHAYNESLSQRRAQAAVDYIINSGISRNRIVARGYGETRLVNHCSDGVNCSEYDHQQNRRTEFTILSLE